MTTDSTLQLLLADPDWPMATDLVELAKSLLDNPRTDSRNEQMARLDGEIQDYRDFCRFRAREKLRGSVVERHAAWEAACLAEACVILQRQSLRDGGYAPPRLFSEPFRVC